MTETVFIQFREEVSHELCGCLYEDIPSKQENIVNEEAYRRYNDWNADRMDRLTEGRDDKDSMAQADLDKRLGI